VLHPTQPATFSWSEGMTNVVQDIERAGARAWTDELEAVAGLLGAAGVLVQATAQRRVLARDLVNRGARSSQVLTCLLHHVRDGRSAAWICGGLRRDPEFVWKLPTSTWNAQSVAGPVAPMAAKVAAMVNKLAAQKECS